MLPLPHGVEEPPDACMLWRYMDLAKLISLLDRRQLHLSSIANFQDDPWEGLWTTPVVEFARDTWPSGGKSSLEEVSQALRRHVYASCWHESPHESAALWNQYAGTAGVAVITRVARLKRALVHSGERLLLGRVRYFDFTGNLGLDPRCYLAPAFMKRASFRHEEEVRVVVDRVLAPVKDVTYQWTPTVALPIDPDMLIEAVRVSPRCEEWTGDAVRALMRRFGMEHVEVTRSRLLEVTR